MKWRNVVAPVRDEKVYNVQVFYSLQMEKKKFRVKPEAGSISRNKTWMCVQHTEIHP